MCRLDHFSCLLIDVTVHCHFFILVASAVRVRQPTGQSGAVINRFGRTEANMDPGGETHQSTGKFVVVTGARTIINPNDVSVDLSAR
jgi:hypothetical protein